MTSAATAFLRVVTGPEAGRRFELRGETVVGREGADVTIEDPELSRRHAVLRPTAHGVVVEDLSAQAAACGLTHDAIEAAVAKHLTDAGFTIRRNSDEDTYVYVSVITTSVSTGLCV